MSARPRVVPPARLRRLARVAGFVVAGIGAAVLVGWAVDVEGLRSVMPGFVTMKANAALAFLLAGGALVALSGRCDPVLAEGPFRRWHRPIGRMAAAVAGAIGLVTVAEYLVAWDPGIDTLLWADAPGARGTVHPGRMAPSAALGFVLCGAALLVQDRRPWGPGSAQALATATVVLALFGLLGYLFGAESRVGLAGATRIAVHTIGGFLVLAAGIFAARLDEGWGSVLIEDDVAGGALRRLVPGALVLPAVLGILIDLGRAAGLYAADFTLPVLVLAVVVASVGLAWLHVLFLRRAEGLRIQAEHALHQSEQRKAAVLDTALDCVVTADHRGRILDFNPAAERTFGYSSEEVTGREIAEVIIPERLRERHREALNRYLETGEATILGRRIEMPAVDSEGREFPVELAIHAIRSGDEPVFTAYLRDITDRRRSEQRLRESVAEKDILLREVHHRVKNNLQVISSLLNLESRRIVEDAGAEAFKRTVQRVRSIAILHERLYRADDVARIDIGSYLVEIAERARRALSPEAPPIEAEIEGSHGPTELDWAVPCGLIVNELVANALRHGRRADDAPPRVRLGARIRSGALLLCVEDDGPGFAEGRRERGDELGLTLVSALVNQLRGTVERGRSPELGGARIEIVVPVADGEGDSRTGYDSDEGGSR